MDTTALLSDLVTQLGRAANLPGLMLDESAHTAVTFNQSVTAHFQARPGDILVYTALGELPSENSPVAIRLLRANFMWVGTEGGTLSVVGLNVAFAQTISPAGLDFQSFQEHFRNFSRTAIHWREQLQEGLSAPEAPRIYKDDELPSFAIAV